MIRTLWLATLLLLVASCGAPEAERESQLDSPETPEVAVDEKEGQSKPPAGLAPEAKDEPRTTAGARTFSRRLSPQAKKAAMLGRGGDRVRVLIQLSAAADPDALRTRLEETEAEPGSFMEDSRLFSAEIASDRLEWLAELPGVVYVELAATYRQ